MRTNGLWTFSLCTCTKSGDNVQCSYNRTIFPMSHSNKVLLKMIAKGLAIKLNEEILEEQLLLMIYSGVLCTR